MKRGVMAIAVLLALAATASRVSGHRLDEYLQAALISVEKDGVEVTLRMIPGVAVTPAVLASMDTNGDGVLSEHEQRAYAERVLRDLSLTIDGQPLTPRLAGLKFPEITEMKEGLGEIQIEFTAELPVAAGERRLVLQNRHETKISAYLVNCLVPRDPEIRIVAQKRNETQSAYELDYMQSGHGSGANAGWKRAREWFERAGFQSVFRLGMRHIAEGTDHLLFLLVLLLPAPLLAAESRWAGFAGVGPSVTRILRVVTAFTVGHSITLALAALGLVRVPSRPTEVLIAFSILLSAAHAFRPIFPGREAAIAALFGLVHGLAFATTLGQLGLGRSERMVNILGFNLGIETMQLVVVAAVMPSLVLLSRWRSYRVMRVAGALLAGSAAMGWVAERLLGWHSGVDAIVGGAAHYAGWMAAALLFASAACSLLQGLRRRVAVPA